MRGIWRISGRLLLVPTALSVLLLPALVLAQATGTIPDILVVEPPPEPEAPAPAKPKPKPKPNKPSPAPMTRADVPDPEAPLAAPVGKVIKIPLSAVQSYTGRMDNLGVGDGSSSVLNIGEGDIVELPVGTSRMIRLPVEARDIMVANAAVADVVVKRQKQFFVVGRNAGSTNVFFLDGKGGVIQTIKIQVNLNIGDLEATIRKLLPGENISVEAVNDSVFLAGSVRSDGAAGNAVLIARRFVAADENVVNLIQIKNEQQVLLRVKVAEMQKTALKELGVQLTSEGGTDYTITGSASSNFVTNTVPFATGTLAALGTKGLGAITATIAALEERGLIKTLAEPNLTTVSGEGASLLAGGEYPIPVSETNGRIIIEYKPFGIGLAFVPVVVGPGRISLKLSTEVSAVDTTISVTVGASGTQVNGLKVRRAETTVEMQSGGSLMIAGMLQNDITETVNGLPYLKDIPILGALFRSTSFQRAESELVILISAFIVEPIDGNQMALPTDGMVPPSDMDQYLFGKLHHTYTGGSPPPKDTIVGPMGYIVE